MMENDFLSGIDLGVPQKPKKLALYLAAATGGVGILISAICFPFLSPGFRRICLPFVPATSEQVKNVFQALKDRSGTLLDIGSGDGRIVVAAAKVGFQADGVELNSWLVRYSKVSALLEGVSSKTSFFKQDLWKFNLKKYNNVVIFGVEEMMEELKAKFKAELKPNCQIVVCRFPIPNSKPIATIGEGVDTVWVYKTPLNNE